MWGRPPDLVPSGARGQHNSAWGALSPAQLVAWVTAGASFHQSKAEAGLGEGSQPGKGAAIPSGWILYKKEGCVRSGLGSAIPPVAWGQDTEMRRLGSAKPRPWACFWAMLTLVGMVTRAGEWAVGRKKGQDLRAPTAHGQEGAVSSRPGWAQSRFDHAAPWRRVASLQGQEGWAGGRAGRGLNHRKTLLLSSVPGS